jgi:hypothetical protein
MQQRPSDQEIADYLAGLNRVSQAVLVTLDTARAKKPDMEVSGDTQGQSKAVTQYILVCQ